MPAHDFLSDFAVLLHSRRKPALAWGCHRAARSASKLGFTALVLCADEHQDHSRTFERDGLVVLRVPMDDAEELPGEPRFRDQVKRAGKAAAALVDKGHRVLVTCHEGRNRSALITAATAYRITRAPGKRISTKMRGLRAHVLTNDGFRAWIESWP